ncbi:MarR family winged helix-turn-helix transcriptional regulator [Paracoccus sp. (in: a-proteobacteria)]|uniref:MarR family winged helix-turn-helix transcriptional regulator n=1 Tax=Paracoccus sp. TaxID=267 RepID=UPI003A87A5B9
MGRDRKSDEKAGQSGAGQGGIAFGPLDGNVGFQLRLASTVMERARKSQTGTDLPLGHFPILYIIRHNPEATQTAIAEAVGLQRSSLVPVLKKLEEAGWISRKGDPGDGRANRVRLTPAGEAACDTLFDEVMVIEDTARRKLGARNYQRLVELLKQLRDRLED